MKSPADNPLRNIVLSINDVEDGLVSATKRHSQELGRELIGIVLVDEKHFDDSSEYKNTFKQILIDFDKPETIQNALKPYQENLLLATCRQESSIDKFRKVIPFLPYVYTPSESSLKWATEKNHMRKRLTDHDSSLGPKFITCESFDKKVVEQVDSELSYPVIVKPSGLAASILVSKCSNKKDLTKALKETFKYIDHAYSRDSGRGERIVLIEEMMPGDMYSVDAYVDHLGNIYHLPIVKVITAHSIGLEGFYSYEIDTKTDLDLIAQQQAFDVVEKAIKALHLNSSTAHVELFYDGETWRIIELGPRIGGYREDMYRAAYGIDHYYNDLAIRMGRSPEINDIPLSHAICFNIYPDKEGTITSISGVEDALKLDSVAYIHQHKKPGDSAKFAGNGGRFVFDGMITDKDYEKLRRDAAKIRELIKIEVTD